MTKPTSDYLLLGDFCQAHGRNKTTLPKRLRKVTRQVKVFFFKSVKEEGEGWLLIRRRGWPSASNLYQGVKPGAGRPPLLIDRDQLLASGHPFQK